MLFRPEDSQCLSPRQQGSKGVGQQQPIDLAHILFLLVTSTGGTVQQPIQMKCLNSSLWRVLACVDKPVDAKIDRADDLDTQTSKTVPLVGLVDRIRQATPEKQYLSCTNLVIMSCKAFYCHHIKQWRQKQQDAQLQS